MLKIDFGDVKQILRKRCSDKLYECKFGLKNRKTKDLGIRLPRTTLMNNKSFHNAYITFGIPLKKAQNGILRVADSQRQTKCIESMLVGMKLDLAGVFGKNIGDTLNMCP